MGYSLVNILGGLLIVTSTMVVVSKTIPSAIKWYAIQSVVLVGVLLTLGLTTGATELLMWAASAFVTKVILVPFILNRAYKKMGSPADGTLTSSIKPAWTIILTGLEVAICFAVVTRLSLPTAEVATPALAISFAHFFVGLTCIISQRNILKQIFGYCLMENGSHVTLALLAPTAPEIIEIGIATDAIFAVIIMSAVVVRIWNDTKSLDSHDLTELKG
ncbi:MAG: hydrogenase 4 membrane subunit [Collinsella sp.]